ncbi:MAG TPA: hypothetical protein PLD25_32035 [Chloroflexota bacterium]|nr:hypothetical protein [Chloroflexota bacterium]HUM69073.1 hypothetical protein [Chloroflexota bacterium]
MQTAIIPLVQEIECYICGSKDIKKVCHHCGRAMCAVHGPFTAPARRFYNRIRNDEYTDLDLPDPDKAETAVHCEYCNHYTVTYEPVFGAMALVGIAAVIVSFASSPIWLTIILTSVGIITFVISVWSIFFQRNYRFRRMKTLFPPLPVWGRFPEIILTETVEGAIAVNANGGYKAHVVRKTGNLCFSLQMGASDLERLSCYRQKYKLTNLVEVSFHAGFAVFSGTGRLQAEDGNQVSKEVNPVQLKGHTVNLSFQNDAGLGGQWNHNHPYRFSLDNQHMSGLPVQIIPTLISEGEDWSLGLYIQIGPRKNAIPCSKPIITELTLQIPGAFGKVENLMPSAKVTHDEQQDCRIITWHNVALDESKPVASKNLSVRFANSKETKPILDVFGQLRVQFEGSISGVNMVALFSPMGGRRGEEVNVSQKGVIEVSFAFPLSALCLRESYAVSSSIEHPTAIPGNEMITRLVNAMNDKGIYVQRVVENSPQMNRANAHIMNRMWVVAGRRYEKATPIDFTVVAVGQEHYEDTDTPNDGKTQFKITAQGSTIREEMRTDIERLRDNIVEVIQETPDLEVDLVESLLYANQWCDLVGIIRNTGRVLAKDISITAEGIKVSTADIISELRPGEPKQFTLSVYSENYGNVPVTVIATCRDQFGQLPPRKKRQQLLVKENHPTPTIGQQTNFYGSSSGPIHTGSGDIRRSNRYG